MSPKEKNNFSGFSLEIFVGKLLVTPAQAGGAIGFATQTTRNKICAGTFPLPLVLTEGGRKMVRVQSIFDYVNGLGGKKKRGAPTKAERLARGAA